MHGWKICLAGQTSPFGVPYAAGFNRYPLGYATPGSPAVPGAVAPNAPFAAPVWIKPCYIHVFPLTWARLFSTSWKTDKSQSEKSKAVFWKLFYRFGGGSVSAVWNWQRISIPLKVAAVGYDAFFSTAQRTPIYAANLGYDASSSCMWKQKTGFFCSWSRDSRIFVPLSSFWLLLTKSLWQFLFGNRPTQ